jgi:hypothetical protein
MSSTFIDGNLPKPHLIVLRERLIDLMRPRGLPDTILISRS